MPAIVYSDLAVGDLVLFVQVFDATFNVPALGVLLRPLASAELTTYHVSESSYEAYLVGQTPSVGIVLPSRVVSLWKNFKVLNTTDLTASLGAPLINLDDL